MGLQNKVPLTEPDMQPFLRTGWFGQVWKSTVMSAMLGTKLAIIFERPGDAGCIFLTESRLDGNAKAMLLYAQSLDTYRKDREDGEWEEERCFYLRTTIRKPIKTNSMSRNRFT